MGDEAAAARVGRLVDAADFERVLRVRSRVQGAHFAVHHLSGVPFRRLGRVPQRQLSTSESSSGGQPVDDPLAEDPGPDAPARSGPTVPALWLGTVVPKRHAKRAVTRNLVKRQIRSLVQARSAGLTPGLWVVRLRAAFDRARFPSASSLPLRHMVRDELEALLRRCTEEALRAKGPQRLSRSA